MQRSSRQARRLMDRMGMSVEEISDVNQVIIRTTTKEIVIDGPDVSLTRVQGQNIYQIMGGKVTEGTISAKDVNIPEEDIGLVSQQANVSFEQARKALETCNGDLAQAIILLTQRAN